MFLEKKKENKKLPFSFREEEEGREYKTKIPAIFLDKVSKNYYSKKNGKKNSLFNVSLTIMDGEFVFIIGESGAGKTTLMKLLTKEIDPSDGKIFVKGNRLKRISKKKAPYYRRNIGMVFQDFRLLKDRNVYQNVAFAMEVVERSPKEIEEKVPLILGLVGLSEKALAFPNELSGGEQQRVAIARAIVNNPSIILADEPTGNLDPKSSKEIMNLLLEINRRGTTVIVVTHNHEIVRSMDMRVISIEGGRIASDSEAEDED